MEPCVAWDLLGLGAAEVRRKLLETAAPEPEPEPEPEPRAEPEGAASVAGAAGAAAAGAERFAPGTCVEIFGLGKAPELNGQRGVVGRFNRSKGRYPVAVGPPPDSRLVGVRPQNLRLEAAASGRKAVDKVSAEGGGIEEKRYKDAIYLSLRAAGISVCLKPAAGAAAGGGAGAEGWRAGEVYLYNEGVDGYRRYAAPLPHGLSWESTNGARNYVPCLLAPAAAAGCPR